MYVEKLYLEITRNCTLECEHCLRGDKKNEYMSIQTIDNIFKDIKEIDKLLLTGGEPLLAINQIKEIIRLVKENKIKINSILLITNATVLNNEVLKALRELKSISDLNLLLSYDMFHYLELNRLNILDKRNENAKVFKEQFEGLEYGDFNEVSKFNGKVINQAIRRRGRATGLTKERLDEINSLSESKYVLEDDAYTNSLYYFNSYYNLYKNVFNGTYTIDVNGNITGYGLPFDEEDIEKNKYSSNVNEIGMYQSMLNYIEYYGELRDKRDQEFMLRLRQD